MSKLICYKCKWLVNYNIVDNLAYCDSCDEYIWYDVNLLLEEPRILHIDKPKMSIEQSEELKDYHDMEFKDFVLKYPWWTKFKARKVFWIKDKKRKDERNNVPQKIVVRQRTYTARYVKELEEIINEKEEQIMIKFWINKNQIKKLLLNNTYTEILNWKMINWKLVIKNLINLVKNS